MARQTNGTNQSLQSASALTLSGSSLLSLSFWLYWDSFANNDAQAVELSADSNGGTNGAVLISVNPNESSSGGFAVVIKGGGGYNAVSFTRPSAAAWHHYAINIDVTQAVNEVPAVYVDGTLQTLDNFLTSNNTGPLGNDVLYLMSRGNTELWAAGRIAEVALWSGINLSSTDASNLASGTLPTSVQSGSLSYYWKLCGSASPETATTGSINMTVNSATSATHPSTVSASCSGGGSGSDIGIVQMIESSTNLIRITVPEETQ